MHDSRSIDEEASSSPNNSGGQERRISKTVSFRSNSYNSTPQNSAPKPILQSGVKLLSPSFCFKHLFVQDKITNSYETGQTKL